MRSFDCTINDDIVKRLLDQVPHIEELKLGGKLSYFKLDNFVNLRVISLAGRIDEKFNLELFKNLCDQLEDIKIRFDNIDEKTLFKMFDGYNFQYLVVFTIHSLHI